MFDREHGLRRGVAGIGVLAVASALLGGCGGGGEGNGQNSLEPAGPEANTIFDLFTPFFWLSVVIGIGVVGGTVFVALRFREKRGTERNPKQVHGNSVLEISWTIIPALILAVMAVFTIPVIFDLQDRAGADDAIEVTVIGRQWFWEYTYTGEEFSSATEMVIPVGRPIVMNVTAPPDGVIHSFWIPELNGKRDAVPGRDGFLQFEADEPGTYLGQCAEYCGLSHADMRMRVIAMTQDDYDDWVDRQKRPLDPEQQRFVDENLAAAEAGDWNCTSCHSFEPQSQIQTGPNLTHVGDRSTFAGGIYETNVENLWQWVHNAPSRKPMGDLEAAKKMPNFSDAGMTKEQAREIAGFLCGTATDPENEERCLTGTDELSTGLKE